MTPPDIAHRLTVRPNEAAALLGVSRRSIERALRDGRLRSTKTIGGRLIVAADVLSLAGVGPLTTAPESRRPRLGLRQ
jgi:excisionase family DNA binding protein